MKPTKRARRWFSISEKLNDLAIEESVDIEIGCKFFHVHSSGRRYHISIEKNGMKIRRSK